jgi:hypothetical protein
MRDKIVLSAAILFIGGFMFFPPLMRADDALRMTVTSVPDGDLQEPLDAEEETDEGSETAEREKQFMNSVDPSTEAVKGGLSLRQAVKEAEYAYLQAGKSAESGNAEKARELYQER